MGNGIDPICHGPRAWRATLVSARVTPLDPALDTLPFDLALQRENRRAQVVRADAALPMAAALHLVAASPQSADGGPASASDASAVPRSAQLLRLAYVTQSPRPGTRLDLLS